RVRCLYHPPPPRRSPRPGRELAAYVAELLDALELPAAHLVGWSLGGGVALHAAAHAPERVRRLVLAAPAGLGPEVTWALRLLGAPLLGPWLARRPLPPLPPGEGPVPVPGLAAQPLPRDFVAAHLAMSRQPWYAQVQLAVAREGGLLFRGQRDMMVDVPLSSLAKPILLLWGREDRVLPLRQGLRAAERLPCARLVVFDDCGHCLPVEHPERFLAEATSFLAAPDPPAVGRA
ncbi:MAG: alpha/beta fold hydrolase, partial [Clostridia bacterium]|nr:alpha/beta fold hydrolase [Clostridia bacterium]